MPVSASVRNIADPFWIQPTKATVNNAAANTLPAQSKIREVLALIVVIIKGYIIR